MGHDAPVLSCAWSPLKPQLIITGSLDLTVRVWDYTSPKQSPVHPTDIKFPKKRSKQKKTAKNVTDNVESHNNLVSSNESRSTNSTEQSTEVIKSSG